MVRSWRQSLLTALSMVAAALQSRNSAVAWTPSHSFIHCRKRSHSTSPNTCRYALPSLPDTIPLLDLFTAEDATSPVSMVSSWFHQSPDTILTPTVPDPSMDPAVQASVLKELSRVILDIITLVAPTTLILRLALVSGRVFGMEAEYLSDHAIAPDELLFDVPLLALYAYLFSRSVYPMIQSIFTKTTELDDLVFNQLFKPVGVSWIQYRSMLAADCIDWISASPGTVLVCEDETGDENEVDYWYWVYEGDYFESYEGSVIYTVERTSGKSIDDPSALGFNGDMRFLYNLDKKKRMQNKQEDEEEVSRKKYPMATTTIGDRGATLMRMNSSRLFELMDDDEQLAASIRELLLKSLQRKVGALLVNRQQGSTEQQDSSKSTVESGSTGP